MIQPDPAPMLFARTRLHRLILWCFSAIAMLCFAAAGASAQETFDDSVFGQSEGGFGGGISFGGLGGINDQPVTWSAKYYLKANGDSKAIGGRVEVEATLGGTWHIYSVTQPAGGPLRTEISIAEPDSVKLAGKFKPDEPPMKSVTDIYPGVTIEEHDGVVVWSAPMIAPAGFKDELKIEVAALVCQTGGSCMPADETLTAKYSGELKESTSTKAAPSETEKSVAEILADPASKTSSFRKPDYAVAWTAGVSKSIAPGDRGKLVLVAKPDEGFHVYETVVDDSRSATNFVITEKSNLLVGRPKTDQPIKSKAAPSVPGLADLPAQRFYEGKVVWELPIFVPEETSAGQYEITGFIGYQACTDSSCLPPEALKLNATVTVSDSTDLTLTGVKMEQASYADAMDLAASTEWVDQFESEASDNASMEELYESLTDEERASLGRRGGGFQESDDSLAVADIAEDESKDASLPFVLLLALGGGLILNLMPCVLPVVGLKVMSFVRQAGEDRRRIFLLNLAYVAGILVVFAVLAGLAVFLDFGWGEQFGFFSVRLGLTVMIFALALSYLGVWELPTPGLATGQSSQELQDKEGVIGAFFTGAFATILATPCSGPLLGAALGYTIFLDGPATFAVLMMVGVGMALPYIFLGLFPSAINFLPKPGNWMVILKEVLAFLLLGTVAFFFNQFSDGQKLPVFVTLIGVWFGCWLIGKVPPWSSFSKRLNGWLVGGASAAVIGWLAFANLTSKDDETLQTGDIQYVVDNHLRWEVYDEERLQELQAAGTTVLLDFTAEWCANCKVNSRIALDTEPTKKMLEQLNGVAMLADFTNRPANIKEKLIELDTKSIPLLAIYPGKSPNEPIVLRDIVTQSMVLRSLEQAGPSLRVDEMDRSNIAGVSERANRLTSLNDAGGAATTAVSH